MSHLILDLILLATAVLCLVRPQDQPHWNVFILKGFLVVLSLVGGWATLLGYAGLLHPYTLSVSLALTAAALWRWRGAETLSFLRSRWESGGLRGLLRCGGEPSGKWTTFEKFLGAGLALFLALQLHAAALQIPLVVDSLCYRLPRIGWWLQEGNLWHADVLDSRLNFMPPLPDLQMLWVTGHWFESYPGTALPQWAGGVALLLGTYALVRAEGGSRRAGLLAAWLVAGMPLAASQFSTDQTDLFTAGVFATGLALFRRGLLGGHLDRWAGLAIGLALAAKPTVFFALPGLALWGGWLWWKAARPRAGWVGFTFAGLLSFALISGPRLVENRLRYGSFLSSPEVARDYLRPDFSLAGLATNLKTSAIQMATPGPLPEVLREPVSAWMARQASGLPENDADVIPGESRPRVLNALAKRRTVDADAAPPGPAMTLAPLLVLAFLWPVLRRSPALSPAVVGGLLAALSFALVFLFLNRWHPYWFRFLSLPAPWLAVAAALALDGRGLLPAMSRGLLVSVSLATGFISWGFCIQSGRLNRTLGTHADDQAALTRLASEVVLYNNDQSPLPITLLLPYNTLMAGYFRTDSGAEVRFAPASAWENPDLTPETLAGPEGGWIITTPTRFAQAAPTGEVYGAGVGKKSLQGEDLAVYRVGPGSPPPQIWLRHAYGDKAPGLSIFSAEVVSPSDHQLPMQVRNFNAFPVIVGGFPGREPFTLGPGETVKTGLPLNKQEGRKIEVTFRTEVPGQEPLVPAVVFTGATPFVFPPPP